jgi:hypothetical protein
MTEAFIQQIKAYKHPLFYNTSGSPMAYKLCIRHLSACVQSGLAYQYGETISPNVPLHIVNLDKEKIEIVEDKIKLVKLKVLP